MLQNYMQEGGQVRQPQRVQSAKSRKKRASAKGTDRNIKKRQQQAARFEEELLNQQRGTVYKKNAEQMMLCQKIYQLASQLEKNRLLAEKREFRETQQKKMAHKKMMVNQMDQFYKDSIQMLKERIQNERYERKIAKKAQQEVRLSLTKFRLFIG